MCNNFVSEKIKCNEDKKELPGAKFDGIGHIFTSSTKAKKVQSLDLE